MKHSVVAATLHRTFKMAVWAGVESSVKLHIERGDPLEARDEQGHTPLMLAAVRNKPHICKLLIDAGASPLAIDPKGRQALDLALEAKAIDAARVLGWSDVGIATPKAFDDSRVAPAILAMPVEVDEVQVFVPYIHDTPEAPSSPLAYEDPIPIRAYRVSAQPEVPLEFVDVASDLIDQLEWISEVDAERPAEDPALIEGLGKTHEAISAFKPIDSSADWSDLDVFLPERSTPRAKSDDPEARAQLRRRCRRICARRWSRKRGTGEGSRRFRGQSGCRPRGMSVSRYRNRSKRFLRLHHVFGNRSRSCHHVGQNSQSESREPP